MDKNEVADEARKTLVVEIAEWLRKLLPYMVGAKKWDTGGMWVCESHRLRPPSNTGYSFDCDCGGPGMPPLNDKLFRAALAGAFTEMCEASINPDLFSKLVDEIIPALQLEA